MNLTIDAQIRARGGKNALSLSSLCLTIQKAPRSWGAAHLVHSVSSFPLHARVSPPTLVTPRKVTAGLH